MLRQSFRRLRGAGGEDSIDAEALTGSEDRLVNTSSTRLFPVARSKGFSPTGPSPTHELELGAYAMSNLSAVAATATVICPDPPDYATVVIEQQPPRSPSLTSDVDTK